jgi:hypothetical protein
MYFQEKKMSKVLIFGMALSLLFVSGSFFGAQAGCELRSNGCPPYSSSYLCGSRNIDKDTMTNQESPATSSGPFNYDTNKKEDLWNGFWQDMAKSSSAY